MLAGTRVLVVEDEYLLADDIEYELLGHGATVIGPVATLDEALAAVAAERPDLAVLDIDLRGTSVFPLAELLRGQGIPFVFTTGYDAAAIPAHLAAVPRCEKPLRSGHLLAALTRLKARLAIEPLIVSRGGRTA